MPDPFTYTLQEFRRQGVRHTISQVVAISGEWPDNIVEFMVNIDTTIELPDGRRIQDVFVFPMEHATTLEEAFDQMEGVVDGSGPAIQARVLADMKAAGPKPQIATAPASLLDSLEYRPQVKSAKRRRRDG